MIHLTAIEIEGQSEAGRFGGRMTFAPGLQVISGPNAFGKSLAAKAVAWCLGLEPMFGRPDNDPTFLPLSLREVIDFPDQLGVRVISSECRLILTRHDGAVIDLARSATHDRAFVSVTEHTSEGPRHSKLLARKDTMRDEHAGLQRFLFEWFGWPRKGVMTFDGREVDIYLENLVPLFYIEQDEGWTDLQARQIGRYGQQQVREMTFEYLLGALTAVDARLDRQRNSVRETGLKVEARGIASRIDLVLRRSGWALEWSANGSLREIEARWSSKTLKQALLSGGHVDLAKERVALTKMTESLREALTKGTLDPSNMSAPVTVSQRVVDLKSRRHELNSDLRTLTQQREATEQLLDSLEHRLLSATDVHRWKATGVGRLSHVECPTCHRDLDLASFKLSAHSVDEVAAHVEALKRDRAMMRRSIEPLLNAVAATEAALLNVDIELREAERALATVTAAVGPIREQLARTAANLSAYERRLDRLTDTVQEIDEIQAAIERWLNAARTATAIPPAADDLKSRVEEFRRALERYLRAFGHSAILDAGVGSLRIADPQYEPYLMDRRLRTLGSASDPPRVVAAYTLALAEASKLTGGLHPGFLVLDEPMQQNPDMPHRSLFTGFLCSQPRDTGFQAVIFTSLLPPEIARLTDAGVDVKVLEGSHFLSLNPSLPN